MTDHRTVLVTGGGGAIGSAVAGRFAREGCTVLVSDHREDACRDAVAALSESAGAVHGIVADLATDTGAAALADEVLATHGTVDVLVNAAGIYPSRLLLDMPPEEWDAVFDLNVRAPFVLSTRLARALVEAGRPGHVVNVTSGAASRSRRGAGHYVASKAALTMLTKAMALELAEHRIHVNAVSPGYIAADSDVNPLSAAYVEAIEAARPWPTAGSPEDVAAVAWFLCSDEAQWMTGSVVDVDGGAGAGSAMLPMA